MNTENEPYEILWERSATKAQKGIDRAALTAILDAVEALATDPRPAKSKPLTGPLAGKTRLRIASRGGEYRVLYVIDDKAQRIVIENLGSREDIY